MIEYNLDGLKYHYRTSMHSRKTACGRDIYNRRGTIVLWESFTGFSELKHKYRCKICERVHKNEREGR